MDLIRDIRIQLGVRDAVDRDFYDGCLWVDTTLTVREVIDTIINALEARDFFFLVGKEGDNTAGIYASPGINELLRKIVKEGNP